MNLDLMKSKYLEDVQINLTKGTYEFYKVHLNYLVKYFNLNGIFKSEELTEEKLKNFIFDERHKSVANATINKRILSLKKMFEYNKIKNSNLSALKKFREEFRTHGILNEKEVNNLLQYLNSNQLKERNKLVIYLLIDTGIRLEELLNIKVSNINFSNRTILLEKTKTHRVRIVPFTEGTAFLLKKFIDNNLFINDKLINLSKSAIESLFRRIKKRLHLNKFCPHMLRHTLATKLHKNSVSLIVIQKIMGHAKVSTTERYIHLDVDDVVEFYNQVMN